MKSSDEKKYGLIEAKVEAALMSRLKGMPVYILQTKKDKDEHLLICANYKPTNDKRGTVVTFFRGGQENGTVDFIKQVTKNVAPTVAVEIDENGKPVKQEKKVKAPSVPRVKTEIKEIEFKSLKDAAASTESCIAIVKGKSWFVSVKGSWAIQENIMTQCKDGLLLVIKEKGYYEYPKSMWNEFQSIFDSGTYKSGKPYSQSILPKKFDKYFTKFK